MSTAYDAAIKDTNRILSGQAKGAENRALHERLDVLSADEKAAAQELARNAS